MREHNFFYCACGTATYLYDAVEKFLVVVLLGHHASQLQVLQVLLHLGLHDLQRQPGTQRFYISNAPSSWMYKHQKIRPAACKCGRQTFGTFETRIL